MISKMIVRALTMQETEKKREKSVDNNGNNQNEMK